MALQGYTKIELTDVETNNTEVYEKHNIVTNALSEIFRPIGYWKTCDTMLNRTSPWVTELCGGMLCFDKPIPEDKNTLFAPAGTTLIACGAYNKVNATSNTIRGDSNKIESVIDSTNRTAKFVYDFKTTQGNGTISSICLTSNRGGYRSYNVPSGADSDSEIIHDYSTYKLGNIIPTISNTTIDSSCKNNERPFLVDTENGIKYSVLYDTIDYIKIIKRSLYTSNMNVFDANINTVSSKLLNQTQIKLNIGSLYSMWVWWSRNDHALYLFYNKSSNDSYVRAGQTIGVIKLSYPDWTAEYFEVVNNTDAEISLYRCCIYNKNLYFTKIYRSNSYYVQPYRINILDSSDYSKMQHSGTIQTGLVEYIYPIDILNGKIMYIGDVTYSSIEYIPSVIIDTELETCSNLDISIASQHSNVIPILNDSFHYIYVCYSNAYLIIPSQYLATINNLESPITKTSDKTMKITYTLKDVN